MIRSALCAALPEAVVVAVVIRLLLLLQLNDGPAPRAHMKTLAMLDNAKCAVRTRVAQQQLPMQLQSSLLLNPQSNPSPLNRNRRLQLLLLLPLLLWRKKQTHLLPAHLKALT